MDLLEGLNPQQLEAVTTTEGYVRVIAGAGSGKTRALSRRFAYLVNEIGILSANILCVTFTNKSANEMKQRIRMLTGDNDTGYIATFHSFCVSVLQEDANAVQYPKSFLVLDNQDIDAMLKIIYEERSLTLRDMSFSKARDMIEIRKIFKEPCYYEDMIAMSLEALKQKYMASQSTEDVIFYGYLYQQKKCFGLDYNDLIKYTLHIFENDEEIRLKWQKRLAYIMIDEFQDIDSLQYRLMQVLCDYHHNLFIVGDPDQTIYTWRGANVKYLLDFDKAFAPTHTVMMMQNYRSTPQIIHAANSLISKNNDRIEKELIPVLESGAEVLYSHARTAEEEAAYIANEIKALAAQDVPLGDIAILYRAHFVSRTLEEAFIKEDIPYVITSGVQFFARMEIKDALSYLRMVTCKDDLSFARIANVPKRNIGERRMAFLQAYSEKEHCSLYTALTRNLEDEIFKNTKAKRFVELIESFSRRIQDAPVSELLAELLDKSGYETMLRTEGGQDRLDNLAELKQSVYEYESSCGEESTIEDYLIHAALYSSADAGTRENAVRMMTVHSAKGLEFPYVFLCSMEEGVFPSRKISTLAGMEEERRLAFVAMTRAERALYLTDSEGRNFDGSFRYPSRFVLDIDQSCLHSIVTLPESLLKDAQEHARHSQNSLRALQQRSSFCAGERVVHSVMGAGTIQSVDDALGAYSIRFDSLSTTRIISFHVKLRAENADDK